MCILNRILIYASSLYFPALLQWAIYSLYFFSILPVKLNANRVVIGTLRGFDQFMNLVVDNTVEVNGDEKTDIGMVVSNSSSCSLRITQRLPTYWPYLNLNNSC